MSLGQVCRRWAGSGEEGIVGLQVVGLDVEFVGGGIAGDDGLGRLGEAAGEAGLVDEGADVSGAEGARGRAPLPCRARAPRAVESPSRRIELADLVFEVDAAAGDLLQVEAASGPRAARRSLRLGARADFLRSRSASMCAGSSMARRRSQERA